MLELDKQYVSNYLFRELSMRFEEAVSAGGMNRGAGGMDA